MNEILNVTNSTINNQTIETVSARDIHMYVENGKDFSDWIKNRIKVGGFIENVDFTILTTKKGITSSGRPFMEYYLSIDMAKSVAMMERNTKGQEIRQWFIDREKKATQLESQLVQQIPTNFSQALKLAYEQSLVIEQQVVVIEEQKEEIYGLNVVIESQKPSVSFVENFVKNNLNMPLTKAFKGLGVAPNKFMEMLRAEGVLYKGGTTNMAKQAHITAGHFVVRYTEYGTQTLISPKGILYITKRFANYIDNNQTT
jgi:anti-repressor protein